MPSWRTSAGWSDADSVRTVARSPSRAASRASARACRWRQSAQFGVEKAMTAGRLTGAHPVSGRAERSRRTRHARHRRASAQTATTAAASATRTSARSSMTTRLSQPLEMEVQEAASAEAEEQVDAGQRHHEQRQPHPIVGTPLASATVAAARTAAPIPCEIGAALDPRRAGRGATGRPGAARHGRGAGKARATH